MSVLQNLVEIPFDGNFRVANEAKADTSTDRIDLTIGAYRDEGQKSVLFEAVKKAKRAIFDDENEHEEYLPLEGHVKFAHAARDLIYSKNLTPQEYEELSKRLYSYHAASATNALYTALTLLASNAPDTKRVFVSDPAWCNYARMAQFVGLEFGTYDYFNRRTMLCDVDAIISSLKSLRKGDIVILQASGHNPTGCDPCLDGWRRIRQVVEEKQLIPLIDMAYQGFASGDLAKDSLPVCEFRHANCDVFVAQSFSKNMGLYSARVGVLHVQVAKGYEKLIPLVRNNLQMISRACMGSPTRHGSEIAYRILTTPELREEWEEQLRSISDRTKHVRKLLSQGLEAANVPGSWEHIEKQKGMFAYLGISPDAVKLLKQRHHIYMTDDARISVAGLNKGNLQKFINALADVLMHAPHKEHGS